MTPTTLQSIAARAERHAEEENWMAARAAWLEALAIEPESAEVMVELSYVESFAGNYRRAHDWTRRASCAAKHSTDSILGLLRRLRTFGEDASLRGLATQVLENGDAPHFVLTECAKQLYSLGDFDLGMRCAEAATLKAPADIDARLQRGQFLASHGRLDDAAVDFEWILARDSRIAPAWWGLSRLRKQTAGSNHVRALQMLLQTPGLRPAEIATAARALHKELDDLGEYEAAWRVLQGFCRVMRSTFRYDMAETRELVEALEAWTPRDVPAGGMPGSVTPIFIVGMHRSGTTLLEQLLAASPQVMSMGELYDFTREMRYATDHHGRIPLDIGIVQRMDGVDFTEVGRRYLDGVAWRLDGHSHFTDKQPTNFFNVGFICRALPQARILHMVRDPVETCFSNLRELFSEANRHSYDQLELADYFLQYRRLMAHWHAAFPGRILDVEYARLTTDPEQVMKEVAAFCGLDFVGGMQSTRTSTRAVATASSVQVRSEIARRESSKWAPYAQHLQPLMEALRAGGIDIPHQS